MKREDNITHAYQLVSILYLKEINNNTVKVNNVNNT